MRLIMLGTGPFALPTFRALYGTSHHVLALFTQPARSGEGKHAAAEGPLRAVAREHGTPVHDPDNINTDAARAQLAAYQPDLLIVCDYGQILAPETLAVAPLGGINLHGSLLPKYRGAAPINWAIYHGETETGITVIHMTPRIDAGPALAQARTQIGPEETAAELEPRLAELGAPLVCRVIDNLAAGHITPIPQDQAQATRAPRLKKGDGAIDWSRDAASIKDQIRAFEPWPKTFTYWHRGPAEPLRLILGPASVCDTAPAEPGTVLVAHGDDLVIATGDRGLALHGVQPAGKRMLSTAEFLRGYAVQTGQRFGESGQRSEVRGR
ncbi:MAG: methionyl-tRNA formyltransferase [Planctomycetes bacterium]|nr:methionyl-tRNA formyltransferase [Planctomycetota bacterium]